MFLTVQWHFQLLKDPAQKGFLILSAPGLFEGTGRTQVSARFLHRVAVHAAYYSVVYSAS